MVKEVSTGQILNRNYKGLSMTNIEKLKAEFDAMTSNEKIQAIDKLGNVLANTTLILTAYGFALDDIKELVALKLKEISSKAN
jgi:hypothetical protein